MSRKAWQLRRINNWLLRAHDRSPLLFSVTVYGIALAIFSGLFWLFQK